VRHLDSGERQLHARVIDDDLAMTTIHEAMASRPSARHQEKEDQEAACTLHVREREVDGQRESGSRRPSAYSGVDASASFVAATLLQVLTIGCALLTAAGVALAPRISRARPSSAI
jgi:hypothetical protein